MADFGAEEDQPTNEERMQIAQHFMLSSPPGQLKDVTTDVKKLIPEGVMTEALEMGIARAYNNKTNKIVKAPSGANVTLSTCGEIDATHYVDTSYGSAFSVNHITFETTEESIDTGMDASIESKRAALQSAVNSYVKSTLADNSSAGCVYAKAGKLTIVIAGEKTNLRNFWGGRWTSTWHVEWGASSTTCTGDIKIHAHYFEDGNTQLHSNKAIPAKTWGTSFSESGSSVADIISHIKDQEAELYQGLHLMYRNMDAETFKSIRRILPVTKLKMDWNATRNSLTKTLQQNK